MSAVKSWSVTICIVSVICTVIEILFRKGKMEKVFQVVLGIMLCSLLITQKKTLENINFDAKKPENFIKDKGKLKSTTDDQIKITAQNKLKRTVEKILAAKNIKPEKINVIMDTNQESCISIKKIEVFLSRGDENKKDTIKSELEKNLELKIDVVVGSE